MSSLSYLSTKYIYGNDSDDYINIYSHEPSLRTTVENLTERVNLKLKSNEYEIAGNMGLIALSNDYYAYQTLFKKNPGTTSSGGKKKPSRRKTRKNRRKY